MFNIDTISRGALEAFFWAVLGFIMAGAVTTAMSRIGVKLSPAVQKTVEVILVSVLVTGTTFFPVSLIPDLLTRMLGGMNAAGGGFLVGAGLVDTVLRNAAVVSAVYFCVLFGIILVGSVVTTTMSGIGVKLSPAVKKTVIVMAALSAGSVGLWALMRIYSFIMSP